jgi:hypothetical protein
MIISIDFDGTIVEDHYPDIGKLMPGAKESVRRLHENGNLIIINTCRDGQLLLEAINFLLEHDIPFDRVNDNLPRNTREYGSNSRKVFADIYIDDRNLGGFPGWKACMAVIEGKGVVEFLAYTGKLNHPVTASVTVSDDGNMIEVAHNTYIDVADKKRGYFYKTIKGFREFTASHSRADLHRCINCHVEKVIPYGINFCSECFDLSYANPGKKKPDDAPKCAKCGGELSKTFFTIQRDGETGVNVCRSCGKSGIDYSLLQGTTHSEINTIDDKINETTRCAKCGVEINDSNRAPSRDNVTFTTTLCKACEEAVSWHLPFLRNEQDDTCDECGNRLTDPYYLIHFHGAPDLKVCPACAKAFRDAGNEYDLVKNSMIDLGDNIFVDAANQKRGYFVKTNKGFRRMSDHSANAVIGTCYRCKEMRLMPAGFNLCSECLDLRKLPIKTWVDNADEQPAEKLKTLRSRPKSN